MKSLTRECNGCRESKPLSAFYESKSVPGKFTKKCRTCATAQVLANRNKKAEYYRQYDCRRDQGPHRRLARDERAKIYRSDGRQAEWRNAWAARNRHKANAHLAVWRAKRDGRLIPQPCEVCGEKAEAHHEDYSKQLDVRWLCPQHHAHHHAVARGNR